MQAIKSFLYLDEYKMYSISSQIFEGITEYLIDYQGTTKEQEEQQRGPIGSGRVMADILRSVQMAQERIYLHDYSYTLFEDFLRDNDRILEISNDSLAASVKEIDEFGFVRIKAQVIFNDMNIIKSTLQEFNGFGEALAYVTNFESINPLQEQLETAAESSNDRNKRARIKQAQKRINATALAKSQGLYQDPNFLENLSIILNYGFEDRFEVQMPVGTYTFSADLKREYLREKEHMMVRKYSRFSEKEFVLLGSVAQSSDRPNGPEVTTQSDSAPEHMKAALMQMVQALSTIEESFTGKMRKEFIIDPIALYSEL